MLGKAIAMVSVAMTVLSAIGQIPTPGFGDKGCPAKPLFFQEAKLSGDDFLEVHKLQSYSRSPVYRVRVYGDGRVNWHGDAAVHSLGDAHARISATEAKALLADARQMNFGGLCDEYVMRALDGGRTVTTLSIGGQIKVVANNAPSDAPAWLYTLQERIALFEPVKELIGGRAAQPPGGR